MSNFLHAFIPIFVAIDIAGLVPVFLTLTHGLTVAQRRRIATQAVITALIIGLLFIAVGTWIFKLLGITVADFEIAGGLLLLVFAVMEILQRGGPREQLPNLMAGPVPLGTPLVAGPAVLTALLVLVPSHGYAITTGVLILNLALVALALFFSQTLVRFIHENGLRAISQVINLFLAAIGVSLIRRGLESLR